MKTRAERLGCVCIDKYSTAIRISGGSIVLLAALCHFPSVGWGATTPVTCSAAGALQTAVNAAAVGDVLQVSGTCTENLIITTNNLTLEAVAAGATITANDPTKPVISVSARFVTIGGVNSSTVGIFTITGGTYALADVLRAECSS